MIHKIEDKGTHMGFVIKISNLYETDSNAIARNYTSFVLGDT
jgi:hypothetical protein